MKRGKAVMEAVLALGFSRLEAETAVAELEERYPELLARCEGKFRCELEVCEREFEKPEVPLVVIENPYVEQSVYPKLRRKSVQRHNSRKVQSLPKQNFVMKQRYNKKS